MEDFIDVNTDWFFQKYIILSPKRFWTMKIALNWFYQNNGMNIVETGTIRVLDDWGAGLSTYLFGEFCQKYQKNLTTVDIDAKAIELSKKITKNFEKNITYVQDDSLHFLANYTKPIDLLYLDSMDCETGDDKDNTPAQEHQKKELKEAYEMLSLRACVLLDDNYYPNGGKTRLAKEFLKSKNWYCLMDYHQSVWIRG